MRTWREDLCITISLLLFPFLFPTHGQAEVTPEREGGQMRIFEHLNASSTVREVLEHPAFTGFAQFLLPNTHGRYEGDMPLGGIGSLLPYHSHVQVDTTVTVLNHLIDEISAGRTIFHDFYTGQQKQEDPEKASTGLFFFKGKPDAPFAIVCPGGGFSYVGSIHEGFPHALALSRRGYNAFVLQYRVGSEQRATEDLAAAATFVFVHARALSVSTENYSFWGGSAGARMVANIGTYGVRSFGGKDLPKPAMVAMAYTGHSSFTKSDPPTFVTISADDPIVNVSTVERRVNAMRAAGVDVAYHKYAHAGHGFGLGLGTDAEGWIEHAVRFWEKHTHLPTEPQRWR